MKKKETSKKPVKEPARKPAPEPEKKAMPEFNKEFAEEINSKFEGLLNDIGANRAQLFNQVLGVHRAIHKELSKAKIDPTREKQIRDQFAATMRMASQQLPHLRHNAHKPTATGAPSVSTGRESGSKPSHNAFKGGRKTLPRPKSM